MLSPTEGVMRYKRYESMAGPILNMTGSRARSVYAETYAVRMGDAIQSAEVLGETMGNQTLSQAWSMDEALSRQLAQVSKVIKSRHALSAERDVFVVKMTGFDSHGIVTDSLFERMAWIDDAMDKFAAEMKNEGVWDDVVVPYISDFGRTITSNGQGTDHAWGGNMLVLGGAINGSRILGQYPDGIGEDDATRISRGRLIPTTPWESMWAPISEWFGVPASKLSALLPNKDKFGTCECDPAAGCEDHLPDPSKSATHKSHCDASAGVWTSSLFDYSTLFADDSKEALAPSPPPPPAPPTSPPAPPTAPTFDHPEECAGSMCCAVIYMNADHCDGPVPIWDLQGWSHQGGDFIQPTKGVGGTSLCGQIRTGWGAHSNSHTSVDRPDDNTKTTLISGGVKVGEYLPSRCTTRR
jgi:hypothetical protein